MNKLRWLCCIVLCWDDGFEVTVPLPTNQAVMEQFTEFCCEIKEVLSSEGNVEVVVFVKSGP
jgi:hypothetical protein